MLLEDMPKFGFGAHGPAEPEPAPPGVAKTHCALRVVCIRSVWKHGNEANVFKSGQEELYGLRRAVSGGDAQILDEPLKTWAEVQRKLAELARSPPADVLIISGHGGAAFQGQADSQTDSARDGGTGHSTIG